MRPPAPGLFSTITCCPQRPVSCSPTRRATTSKAVPTGSGKTILIGLVGKAFWAAAGAATPNPDANGRARGNTVSNLLLPPFTQDLTPQAAVQRVKPAPAGPVPKSC